MAGPAKNTRGLLFIPDISGFTHFVSNLEVEHSQLIIQELLENLINSNHLGLEVSEIEGDAILFYRFGAPPDLNEIYRQVETMFRGFHRSLLAYDYRKYCQCQACMSAVNLTLKVITHYGEFTSYTLNNFTPLHGRDVIVAHRLLKNDIDHNEYWMVTESLTRGQELSIPDAMNWEKGSQTTELGDIVFHYLPLSNLREGLSPQITPGPDLSKKVKVITRSRVYHTDIISLFHATGDFNNRHLWKEGVKRMEEVSHFLPRIGMRCRCVLEDGEEITYSSSYSYQADRIEFSETEEAGQTTVYYILEKTGENKTKLTINYYLRKNLVSMTLFKFKKQKELEENLDKSLLNLEHLLIQKTNNI